MPLDGEPDLSPRLHTPLPSTQMRTACSGPGIFKLTVNPSAVAKAHTDNSQTQINRFSVNTRYEEEANNQPAKHTQQISYQLSLSLAVKGSCKDFAPEAQESIVLIGQNSD